MTMSMLAYAHQQQHLHNTLEIPLETAFWPNRCEARFAHCECALNTRCILELNIIELKMRIWNGILLLIATTSICLKIEPQTSWIKGNLHEYWISVSSIWTQNKRFLLRLFASFMAFFDILPLFHSTQQRNCLFKLFVLRFLFAIFFLTFSITFRHFQRTLSTKLIFSNATTFNVRCMQIRRHRIVCAFSWNHEPWICRIQYSKFNVNAGSTN